MRIILASLLVLSIGAHAVASQSGKFVLACAVGNDLFQVLTSNKIACERFDSAARAVKSAKPGSGVLILADSYPAQTTEVDPALLEEAAKKKLRLYVEFPSALPGIEFGRPVEAHVERLVVQSDFFGERLPKLRLASVNGLRYLPTQASSSHLATARVAGFDTAVYGLPPKAAPILFELPGKNVLVATTKLSGFVSGRYAPQDSWREIWKGILTWVAPDAAIPPLVWTPTVRATYTRDDKLPPDFEQAAFRRSVDWYRRSKMIIHPSFAKQVVGKNWVESVPVDAPMGDGSLGSMEGVLSVIHQDGSQRVSSVQRGDCICETAMALAFSGKLLENKQHQLVARNLLDYYLLESEARKQERGDPNHGAFGLVSWGVKNPEWYAANYGDDNARVILATLAVAALTKDDRWDDAMMMCLLANLRTTGQLGFRGNNINVGEFAKGWESFFRAKNVSMRPHYEAYLWACYLWAYQQTGDDLFLNRAETALKITMDHYTDDWQWTNGLSQEKARILLPLAWLVRVKGTPENRAMLLKAAKGLIAIQDETGAIREELGSLKNGQYPPPASNAAYGTNEASLIAKNGDPVADMLYTTNFAFLGLHEAAAATNDKDIIEAEDKLAKFLCRIQVKSDTQSALDGGWFRAFDYGRWEPWGCNADHGWGAWAIESGWTQGWIASVFALRQMDTSLWDLTLNSNIERNYDRLRKQMIPQATGGDVRR